MKKGISLVMLAFTIIILAILAGVMIIRADYSFVDSDIAMLQVDIAQIESLMSIYKIRNNGNIDFPTVQFSTSGLSGQELVQFSGENIVNNQIQLYVVNIGAIDGETSNFGNLKFGSKDRYLYSINTGKVYYEQGIEVDGITYYYIKNGEIGL